MGSEAVRRGFSELDWLVLWPGRVADDRSQSTGVLLEALGGSQRAHEATPFGCATHRGSLKLTENCQAKCVTCDYWKTRWEDGLSTERAVETINRLSDFGIRYLRFTGGEPLLRRDLFEILRRADTSRFKRISLQTNGLLLKKLHK